MKKIVFILSVAFLICSFGGSVESKDGIRFFKGSWSEALAKAKQEKKFIFLDVYASWCAPCKQLKRTTFKDGEVGEYFNKNFINVAIDGESEEGLVLANKYQVNSYPTLLIVDHNANRKAKSTGFLKPRPLVNFGRRVVP